MRTSICKECIYIGDFKLKVIQDSICNTTRRSPVCNCLDNAARNYVTGDFVNSFCEDVNRYGECRFFKWIHPMTPNIYSENNLVVMTFSNYKEGDEIYYTTKEEEPSVETWTLYTDMIELTETTTFRAFVYRPATKEISDVRVIECKVV